MQNTPRNLSIIRKLLESRNLAEAALPDYRTVLDAAKGSNLPTVGTFQTRRGSTYAHLGDASTVRNRIGSDGNYTVQPKSVKTIFMDPTHLDQFGGIHQNPDIPTEFKPTGPNTASLHYTAPYGPRKAGEKVPGTEFPFQTKPKLGMAPVEIWNPTHPKGIHFGNEIIHMSDAMPDADKEFGPGNEFDDLEKLPKLPEEAPVNNAGGGNVAGIGVGPKGEPGRPAELMPLLRRKKDFAGQAVFEVSSKLFNEMRLQKRDYQRWGKYLQEEEGLDEIRNYARKNPRKPIILQDENSGCMCYAKYGKR